MTRQSPDKLRIAIVTSGRFHVCDLARELASLGHDVKFYSLVPPWRTKKFGLPRECNKWMLPSVAIPAACLRLVRSATAKELATQRLIIAFDEAVSRVIEPCDVLIGMSGLCNKLALTVKSKFGAQVWIERGSRHILSQREILASIPGAGGVSDFVVQRELTDYDQADYIAVLSKHCEDSFLEQGIAPSKLVRNPLGVNLKMFAPTVSPPRDPQTIIMTGNWSLRKGCDTLVDAWRMLPETRLIHVGPIGGDCPLPQDRNFIHHDKVDQSQLIQFYSQAHVFALASREEGLATVQPQALACGLRLVCSTRTGGEDLKAFTSVESAIRVVPPNDSVALAAAIKLSLAEATGDVGLRRLLHDEGLALLSWQGYGDRYSQAITARFKSHEN